MSVGPSSYFVNWVRGLTDLRSSRLVWATAEKDPSQHKANKFPQPFSKAALFSDLEGFAVFFFFTSSNRYRNAIIQVIHTALYVFYSKNKTICRQHPLHTCTHIPVSRLETFSNHTPWPSNKKPLYLQEDNFFTFRVTFVTLKPKDSKTQLHISSIIHIAER